MNPSLDSLSVIFVALFPLFIYSLVVAVIARTVTQEEIFRELKEFAKRQVEAPGAGLFRRKVFYPLTCQYCFSHWVTAVVLMLTGFNLFGQDYNIVSFFITLFAIVGLANAMLVAYEHKTVKIKFDRTNAALSEYVGRKALVEAENTEYNWSQLKQAIREHQEQTAQIQAQQLAAAAQGGVKDAAEKAFDLLPSMTVKKDVN